MHDDLAARYYHLLGAKRRVLDLGCGIGEFGRCKPSGGLKVFGIDINKNNLREARKWESVVLCDLDEEKIPFRSGSFDAVLAKDILEHVYRPWKIMAEINRVLVTDGRLLVNAPLPKPDVVWNDYTHVRGFTKQALQQLLMDYGFEVMQFGQMGGLRGFGRLNLVNFLPMIMNLPLVGRLLAINNEVLSKKIS